MFISIQGLIRSLDLQQGHQARLSVLSPPSTLVTCCCDQTPEKKKLRGGEGARDPSPFPTHAHELPGKTR